MDKTELRAYCGSKTGAEETFPFGEQTSVFKVMGKLFALIPLDIPDDKPASISLKCDPSFAEILRQTYDSVTAGYHMNKKHWNTITCDDTIPEDDLREWIDQSYELVVKGLTKKDKTALKALEG